MVRLLILLFFPLLVQSQINPIIEIETEMGIIGIELYQDKAPVTAKNYIRYIEEKRYKGATFYRTVTTDNQPNSGTKIQVIQGGLFDDDHPGFLPPIKHENTKETGVLHLNGTISMARYEPGTATFEFFICIGDQPSLDFGGMRNSDGQGFAAFGKVIYGMRIVEEIHRQPEEGQYLNPRIPIISMSVVPQY